MIISAPGGGGFQMAPDLSFPTPMTAYTMTTGIDATGSLTELLSLTGKFLLGALYLQNTLANDVREIKLVIDGVDIWNLTGMSFNGTVVNMLGELTELREDFLVNTSLTFSILMATDNAIDFGYTARPIL